MSVSERSPALTDERPIDDQPADSSTLPGMAADARHEAGATIESMRAAAGDLGDRMPEMVRTVRTSATEGARTIQSWPEPTQRLMAVFSLGLGVGLMVAGAPRLVVGGALVPAVAVAASTLGREASWPRRSA